MQAIIFAAGRGTRMRELGETTPKCMLEVDGEPILVHKIRALPKDITEVILVVGYLGGIINQYFGGEFDGRNILYVEQENPKGGTADALWQAKGILQGKFIAMNGDDLYATRDLEEMMRVSDWAMLVLEREQMGSGGRVVFDSHKHIKEIVEGKHEGSGYVNAGVYTLDERIFSYAPIPKGEGESELGLPQTIMTAVNDIPIHAVEASEWIQITAPEDLETATRLIHDKK